MEFDREEHNMVYYNQILRSDKKKKRLKKKKSTAFTQQEVRLKDYVFVPEGWETFMYTFYFLAVPYVAGAVFLFFSVAGADYDNFKLLNMQAFFIVWAIGYEIVATITLLSILVMFLKYDEDD